MSYLKQDTSKHKKHTSTTLELVKNRFNIRGDIPTKPNTSVL